MSLPTMLARKASSMSRSGLLTDMYRSTGYLFSIKDPIFSSGISDATKETFKPDHILTTLKETNKLTDEEYTMYARDIIKVFETHAESGCFDKKAAAHVTKLWRELIEKLYFRAGRADTLEVKKVVRQPVTSLLRAPDIPTGRHQAMSLHKDRSNVPSTVYQAGTSSMNPSEDSMAEEVSDTSDAGMPDLIAEDISNGPDSGQYTSKQSLTDNLSLLFESLSTGRTSKLMVNPAHTGRSIGINKDAAPLIRPPPQSSVGLATQATTEPDSEHYPLGQSGYLCPATNRSMPLPTAPTARTIPRNDSDFSPFGQSGYPCQLTDHFKPSSLTPSAESMPMTDKEFFEGPAKSANRRPPQNVSQPPLHPVVNPKPVSSEDPFAWPSITAKQRPPHMRSQPTPQSRYLPGLTTAMPKAMTADDEAFHYPARFPNKSTPWYGYYPVYPTPTSPFEIELTGMTDDDLFFNFNHSYPVPPISQRPFKHSKRSAAPTRWSQYGIGMTHQDLVRGAEISVADELEHENEDKEWMVVQKEDGEEEWDIVERVSS